MRQKRTLDTYFSITCRPNKSDWRSEPKIDFAVTGRRKTRRQSQNKIIVGDGQNQRLQPNHQREQAGRRRGWWREAIIGRPYGWSLRGEEVRHGYMQGTSGCGERMGGVIWLHLATLYSRPCRRSHSRASPPRLRAPAPARRRDLNASSNQRNRPRPRPPTPRPRPPHSPP